MRRRDFIAGLCGTAAWPLAARAQQPTTRVRQIGIISYKAESNSDERELRDQFSTRLRELGWIEGQCPHRISVCRQRCRTHAHFRSGVVMTPERQPELEP
jgi:hypothetical protein